MFPILSLTASSIYVRNVTRFQKKALEEPIRSEPVHSR